MLLFIDNYDSFTYNIVQYFAELGQEISVRRNDDITLDEIAELQPQYLVIGPGPCSPKEAGISVPALRRFAGQIPILGVCLGHQAIGEAFGGRIVRAQELMHGKVSPVHHTNNGVFAGLPNAPACPNVSTSPPGRQTAKSWACAINNTPWKAYNSTPKPCSPNTATICWPTSSKSTPPAIASEPNFRSCVGSLHRKLKAT